jgi:hypothetical protein
MSHKIPIDQEFLEMADENPILNWLLQRWRMGEITRFEDVWRLATAALFSSFKEWQEIAKKNAEERVIKIDLQVGALGMTKEDFARPEIHRYEGSPLIGVLYSFCRTTTSSVLQLAELDRTKGGVCIACEHIRLIREQAHKLGGEQTMPETKPDLNSAHEDTDSRKVFPFLTPRRVWEAKNPFPGCPVAFELYNSNHEPCGEHWVSTNMEGDTVLINWGKMVAGYLEVVKR